MDALEIFQSMVNHPVKIAILKHMNENNYTPKSVSELRLLFVKDDDLADRVTFITTIWEMYNDHLISKVENEHGVLFTLTDQGRELNKIMSDLDSWSAEHEFFGGI
ncbi:hypothetical protein EF384_02935 [Aerococcus agrisoli]|uniref:Transcriptional regulator n=1 Tax=Aerococcus agrisoli TaxID=2487350 RepID=A0A3N4GK80_9LACT|nr:hypothetical protein [Aerococcus agrisoli]RPA60986.1 hypothetical protein EF384_02935 [Aerococcus agrisoli]